MNYVCEGTEIAAMNEIGKRFGASSCPVQLTAPTGSPVTGMEAFLNF